MAGRGAGATATAHTSIEMRCDSVQEATGGVGEVATAAVEGEEVAEVAERQWWRGGWQRGKGGGGAHFFIFASPATSGTSF